MAEGEARLGDGLGRVGLGSPSFSFSGFVFCSAFFFFFFLLIAGRSRHNRSLTYHNLLPISRELLGKNSRGEEKSNTRSLSNFTI